jgi:hypothetical protein
MKKFIGWALVALGSWMLVSPQSLTGLKALRWMSKYAFPAEVFLGVAVLSLAYLFLDFPVPTNEKPTH